MSDQKIGGHRDRMVGDTAKPASSGFDVVSELTRSFVEASQQQSPPLVQYMGQVKDGLKPTLLRNLLQVDLERRRREREQPSIEDYLKLFPDQESLIREEFLESTFIHQPAAQSLLAPSETSSSAPGFRRPITSRLGQYHLIRELGRGGMGWVFEAVHIERKEHIALKVLPDLNAESLHRFKQEFRTVAEINHLNLIGLHSLECDGDQWFFTMDLIDGVDFLSFVRPRGALDEQRLRSAFRQLVSGVIALHSNYVIHRDLKPSNVMVTHDGRAVLLDFGLVVDVDHSTGAHTASDIAGTPAYMSPEQASGQSVDFSCDWYATGVMLYQALTGSLPFTGSALTILNLKKHHDAPQIASSADIPDDLRSLATQLVSRRPEDRPDAFAITKALSLSAAGSIRNQVEQQHQLVGREVQLAEMAEAFSEFQRFRRPYAVFVDGRSGEGKTSLCEAFMQPLLADDRFAVMSGRCYDRESVPFKALDNAIDAICHFLNRLDERRVSELLPRDVSVLSRVFPVIGRIGAVANAPKANLDNADEQEIRGRAFAALRDLLGRISDRTPVILFVDDLQWGDAESAEMLLQLLRPPNPPHLFFIGTYRSDETDDSRFLKAWDIHQETAGIGLDRLGVSVGPLTLPQVEQLVVEQLHQDTPTIRDRAAEFHQHTGGNAFLVLELVSCYDPQTNSFRSIPVNEVIDEKLARLPEQAKSLLEITAVSGQALKASEAAAVAQLQSTPISTFARMRSERLIRFLGSEEDGRIDTYHDRIRETVLSHLEAERKNSLHAQFAAWIEQTSGGLSEAQLCRLEDTGDLDGVISDRLFDLVFHFSAVGDDRRISAYALLAARQSRQQFALDVAAEQYQLAREHFGRFSKEAKRKLFVEAGDVLRLLSRYKHAEQCLSEAHELAVEDLDRCEVELLQAELMRGGHNQYAASAELLENSLRSLGISIPRSRLGLAIKLLREVLIQVAHTWRKPTRRPETELNRREKLIINLFESLTRSYWFRSSPALFCYHLAGFNRAESADTSRGLADARRMHGVLCAAIGMRNRGFRCLDLAEQACESNDLSAKLNDHLYRTLALFTSSSYEECKNTAAAGLGLVDRTGDVWRAVIMRLHHALADFRLGNLRASLEHSVEAFEASLRAGDANTAHDYVNVIAMLTRGAFNYPEMAANLIPIPDNIQATNQSLQAQAWWHLHHGRTREGLNVAQEAFDLVRRHLVINHITSTNLPLLLRAMRMHALAVEPEQPAEAKKLIRRAQRLAVVATKLTENFPDASSTLRERAALKAMRGHWKGALKIVTKSLQIAEAQHAAYEASLARRDCVVYQNQLGLSNSQDLEKAKQTVCEFEEEIEAIRDRYHWLAANSSHKHGAAETSVKGG